MLTPTQEVSSKQINFDIEALRGFAALFVVWFHANLYSSLLDPSFKLTGVLTYGPYGHFCVLIFFVLSGYVIGLSNKKPLNWTTIPVYIKKRLVRLYPIFVVALLLTCLLALQQIALIDIAGNLLMLQSLLFKIINPPSWSLHFEVLYYIIFIFISAFRFNPYITAILAFALGLVNLALAPVLHTPIVTSYCYGLVFWLLGLGISRWLSRAEDEKVSYQVLVSCILFILCIQQYNPFDTLLHKVSTVMGVSFTFPKFTPWDQMIITFFDLSCIPSAVLIVLIFTGKKVPYRLTMMKMLLGISGVNLIYVIRHAYSGDLNWSEYALPTFFFLVSAVFLFIRNIWLEKASKLLIRIGIRLGGLSYAIYLIHFPLLLLFSRIKIFSGTWLTFGLRFALLLVLTLGLSYLLEEIMQPLIKDYFFKAKPSASTPSVA